MKTKLTTEQQIEIDRIKVAIVDLSAQQDSLYAKLLSDLNIVDQDEDEALAYIRKLVFSAHKGFKTKMKNAMHGIATGSTA